MSRAAALSQKFKKKKKLIKVRHLEGGGRYGASMAALFNKPYGAIQSRDPMLA